jgi:VIT1/CCC1 family predicted Fe2+/Mn2+ transporter
MKIVIPEVVREHLTVTDREELAISIQNRPRQTALITTVAIITLGALAALFGLTYFVFPESEVVTREVPTIVTAAAAAIGGFLLGWRASLSKQE